MAIATDMYKDQNERNRCQYQAYYHQSTMHLHADITQSWSFQTEKLVWF